MIDSGVFIFRRKILSGIKASATAIRMKMRQIPREDAPTDQV